MLETRPVVGETSDLELQPWVEMLDSLSTGAVNLTIGLIAGSRHPNERCVLDRLACTGLSHRPAGGLLIRLNFGTEAMSKRQLRTARASEQSPTPVVSPLGTWRETTLPMQSTLTAPPALERLPRWLTAWKRQYSRILVDLGPLDQPICRSLARFCDCTILILGPETCASPTWLRRHIDHLTQCDATLSGSIVVSGASAAMARRA